MAKPKQKTVVGPRRHDAYHPLTAKRRSDKREKLGLKESTAIAVGGMIGGGVFSVLGITIALAGHLAFGCFVLGGLLAALTARSYAELTRQAGRSGGPFAYLRLAGHPGAAAWVSWLLVLGYIFALGVYAFSFGHYFANLFGAGELVAQAAAAGLLAVFLGLNLRGVRSSGLTEDFVVAAKLTLMFVVALVGIASFHAARLAPLDNIGFGGLFLGTGVIFLAYEGFELLPYDYDDIIKPQRTLPRALYLSVGIVALVYIAVTIGSQMLVPDSVLAAQKEITFAAVGQAALGTAGLWIATAAALLATASAINATLFSTARLVRDLSQADELPEGLGRERRSLPTVALIWLAILAAALALLPGITELVAFGSLTFLVVFLLINYLGTKHAERRIGTVLAWIGTVGCAVALAGLVAYLAESDLLGLGLITACLGALVVARLLFVRFRTARL